MVALRVVVVAGLVLALSGCGGAEPRVASVRSTQPTDSSSAPPSGDVAAYLEAMRGWVKCLRDQGIDVSDPDPTGVVTFPGDPATQMSDPKIVAAQQKCASVEPAVPEAIIDLRKPKLTAEQIETTRRYARCMQQNGAPDFPDPRADGYLPRDKQWDQAAPGAQQAARACASIVGAPADPGLGQG